MRRKRKRPQCGNRARRIRRKRWLLRRARRDFLRPRIAVYRARSGIARWGGIDKYTARSVTDKGDGLHEIVLPPHLDFEENYETTTRHFKLVRDAALGRYRIRRLGFENITYISPAAALVLASEVDMWRERVGGWLRAAHESWNEDIRRLLSEMGYFELLRLERPAAPESPGNVTFLNFQRGASGPVDKGKLAQDLRKAIEGIVGQQIKKHEFFQGLSEAMVNVGQHAYPFATVVDSKKYWWQSASFNRRDRTLTVMFYDQGIGIPKSLPADGFVERIKARFEAWPDSVKIKAAMKYGRSQTRRGERGKGLQDLVRFAEAYPEGRLSIYSRKGLYRTLHIGDDKPRRTLRDHERSVGGTLIEWSVKL